MHLDIAWPDVDTVLLDMDGTLLDLAFDSHFWLTLVPETLSQQRGITLEEAHLYIRQEYHAVQHTLNWYCLDYWSERLGLDICAMTTQQGPRAVLRDDTVPFLDALKACGKQRILLTNAHPHNLAVKLEYTGLGAHLDLLLSTHTFGYPKEDQRLWETVQAHTGLNPARTLFIDDSEPILDAAARFGIRYCLGVTNPDSGVAEKIYHRHAALNDYRRLIPSLHPFCKTGDDHERENAV
ncbi:MULTISPECIES: GMP/IMP nucleotidase [Atlantibacter]|uniref:GMP/IMP nucleotidase n=1 Tax=Atlantibacter TaxID=1903434 RepID=UPI002587F8CB|nr:MULTISPECIES: GMP/IMP nucleotidase [Atlantibacter]